MSRSDSILPASSRYKSGPVESYKSRGSYSSAQNSQSTARSQRLENSGRIKLDKVSISDEAKNIELTSNRETGAQTYNRLSKYSY